ncbi:hypothetical protein [Sinorhizobium meliloti]|nr:hypothetical protein [Sinorhizobium meliloti]
MEHDESERRQTGRLQDGSHACNAAKEEIPFWRETDFHPSP